MLGQQLVQVQPWKLMVGAKAGQTVAAGQPGRPAALPGV
jgi:hypothetical protein